MRIDRVILATDGNPLYLEFWPLVARAWQRILSVRPTLALIGDETISVPEGFGDVVRFAPVSGVETALQSQTIRLLLPTLFPQDVCLLSDLDMLPLNGSYFARALVSLPSDCFVVYRDAAYPAQERRIPICYNVARGDTFREIFGAGTDDAMARTISDWAARSLGWHTDELVLYEALQNWSHAATRCVRLGRDRLRRIDRQRWRFRPWLVPLGWYDDAHLLRPYAAHRREIDRLAWWAGLGDPHRSGGVQMVSKSDSGKGASSETTVV